VASENDFTIGFRRSLIKNKELAGRLVHQKGAVPMVFQYNPLDFYIESSADGDCSFHHAGQIILHRKFGTTFMIPGMLYDSLS
jgi:hypothetical protein